jgi:hypothetical protein
MFLEGDDGDETLFIFTSSEGKRGVGIGYRLTKLGRGDRLPSDRTFFSKEIRMQSTSS